MQQLGYAHQEPWEEVPPGERVCMRALKLLRASFLPGLEFCRCGRDEPYNLHRITTAPKSLSIRRVMARAADRNMSAIRGYVDRTISILLERDDYYCGTESRLSQN